MCANNGKFKGRGNEPMRRVPSIALRLAAVLFGLGAPAVASEADPQVFFSMPLKQEDPAAVASIAGHCTPEHGRLHCFLVRLSVEVPKLPPGTAAELDKLIAEAGGPGGSPGLRELCKDTTWFSKAATQSDLSPRRRAWAARHLDVIKRMCAVPTRETITAWWRSLIEMDAKTCKVGVRQWTETFESVSQDVWMSRRGPEGECAVIDVSRLVLSPKTTPRSMVRFVHEFETQTTVGMKTGACATSGIESRARYSDMAPEPTLAGTCEEIEWVAR
jgi:hypothetical protein